MQSIIIIDDEIDVRDAIARVLTRAGYAVRGAATVLEALAELERDPAEVVVTDIIMPTIDGVQAIQFIRKAFPLVRVIAISGGGNFAAAYQPTALTTTAYLAAAAEAGAHEVLTKPFEAQELIKAIERVLGVGHA